MSLKFLGAFASAKVRDANTALTQALVSFDPKGATEAQMQLMEGQLNELGKKVASTKRQHDEATAALAAAQKLHNQRLSAAEALAADPTKEDSLNKLLTIIEQAAPQLETLKQDDAEIAAYETELRSAYEAAAAKLRDARSQLQTAARQMEHAKLKQERASQMADAAAAAAGIHKGGDALNVALDAMKAKTAAAEDAASASNMKASSLAPQDHEKDDPAIAAALAAASGHPVAPLSAAERLASLKKAA